MERSFRLLELAQSRQTAFGRTLPVWGLYTVLILVSHEAEGQPPLSPVFRHRLLMRLVHKAAPIIFLRAARVKLEWV